MDFSSLVKAVQDFWNFIWPPVLCTAALMGISWIVAPNVCRRTGAALLAHKPSPETQIAFAKAAKRFGLDKLAPILAAFTLLFLLSAIKNVVLVAGALVPVEITFNPDALLRNHAVDPKVADLWFSYGGKDDISGFREQIQRTVDEAKQKNADAQVVNGLGYWQRTAGGDTEMFNACKFLALWTIGMVLLELRLKGGRVRAFARGVLLSVTLLLTGSVYVVLYLYATDQEQYEALTVAEVYKTPEIHNCYSSSETDDAKCKTFQDTLHPPSYGAGERWWHINFAPSSVVQWVVRSIEEKRGMVPRF